MEQLKEPLESPTKESGVDTSDTYPGDGYVRQMVPLDDVEGTKLKTTGRWGQLLAVLVSGVALFSDGYNLQGELLHLTYRLDADTLSHW